MITKKTSRQSQSEIIRARTKRASLRRQGITITIRVAEVAVVVAVIDIVDDTTGLVHDREVAVREVEV
jgi:hypothetical protein